MRILVVHAPSRESITGEDLAADAQIGVLRQAGHDVEVFPGSGDRSSAVELVKGRNPGLVAVLERFQPDVVHLHKWFPDLGRHDWGYIQVPVVCTVHNFRPLCPVGTLFRDGRFCDDCVSRRPWPLLAHNCHGRGMPGSVAAAIWRPMTGREHPIFRTVSRFIVPSQRAAGVLHDLAGVPQARMDIIPSFVSPASTADDGSPPEVPAGLLFVGQLEETKGIRELIDHLPAGEHLSVVGTGSLEAELKAIAQGKDVEFLGGLDHDQVLRRMRSSEVLVFPSRYLETQGLVVSECAAVGTPVIALDGTAGADQVSEHGFGVVLDDLSELSVALRRVRAGRGQFAANGKRYSHTRLTSAAWLRSVVDSYHRATPTP